MKTASLNFITLAILAFPPGLAAQEFRSAITGAITDPAGAMVPGAQVTASETNSVRLGARSVF